MLQASLAAILASCFAIIILPQYDNNQIGSFIQSFSEIALAAIVLFVIGMLIVSIILYFSTNRGSIK
jgi:hypothetical protein